MTLLQQSDDPEQRTAGAMLEAINDLRDEVRRIALPASRPSPSRAASRQVILHLLAAGEPLTREEIGDRIRGVTGTLVSQDMVWRRLRSLEVDGEVERVGTDRWTARRG